VLRRLLVVLLFSLVLAGGALLTWHARNQALLVENDLAVARTLLASAGGFQAGKLAARLELIDQAAAHAAPARHGCGVLPCASSAPCPSSAATCGSPGR
jgi:hypothetical protein